MGSTFDSLGPLCRWYIYAIHGFVAEILFTAACTFIDTRCWKLMGVTSVWVLFIYGTFGMFLERLYLRLPCRCNCLVRGVLYTICIYIWEFSTGYILRCFNACPWDYSGFRYNFMGLVTLEYFPIWFAASLLLERMVCDVLRLRVDKSCNPKDCSLSRPTPQTPGKLE